MVQVSNFEQVRIDGNVIPAAMTVGEMLAHDWGPAMVIALRWLSNGKTIEHTAPNGVHGIAVPGANYVAALIEEDSSGTDSRLTILSADGSLHGRLENNLKEAGIDADGYFGWFEPAMSPGADRFGIVFQVADGGEFRCDIDAKDLRVLAVVRIR